MSCGQPHDIDCGEILRQVYTYLDGELDPNGCADMRKHLDECGPCLREYGLDQVVKRLVARHCGCDPVPEDLRAKVLIRIAQVRAELSDG